MDAIKASVEENGQYKPLVVQKSTMRVLAGNHTLEALKASGATSVPVYLIDVDDERAKRIVLADNRTSDVAAYDDALLAELLKDLQQTKGGLAGTGYDEDALAQLLADPPVKQDLSGNLARRFMCPPFSVLNAREGWWQERKAAWISLGIESEVGRGGELLGFSSAAASFGRMLPSKRGKVKKGLAFGEIANYDGANRLMQGTSIFDPVLCELAYRWFCPNKGRVLDPFAGGSVRGIVASKLGLEYVGIDLRQEQIDANMEQAVRIVPDNVPEWVKGDSRDLAALTDGGFDFILTCPPYHDLEKYSEDPADLSNMDWPTFCEVFGQIISAAATALKEDSFAVIVIGDVRAPSGNQRNLPGITAMLAQRAGLELYNDAILVTAVGSLPIRAGRQFEAGRKLGRTHQNVLVFVKGDAKKAVAKLAPPEFGDLSEGIRPDEESGQE